MDHENSEFREQSLRETNIDAGTADVPNTVSGDNSSTKTEEEQSSNAIAETGNEGTDQFRNGGDAESDADVRSHFSDSSSDGETSPTRESEQDSTPVSDETSPARPLTYDELTRADLGNPFDDDADEEFQAILSGRPRQSRFVEALPEATREDLNQIRGLQRPPSPFGGTRSGDLIRRDHNWNTGERRFLHIIEECSGARPRHRGQPSVPSWLRFVRSVDDVSPQNSPIEQERESDASSESSGGWSDFSNYQREDTEGDEDDTQDSVPESEEDNDGRQDREQSSTGLHVSTAEANIPHGEAEQDLQTSDLPVQEAPVTPNDDPTTPSSPEELEIVTGVSTEDLAEHLEMLSVAFHTLDLDSPAATLQLKRDIFDVFERGRFNALDDKVIKTFEEKHGTTVSDMWQWMAAHFYKLQRDESRRERDHFCDEVTHQRKILEEDGYEISMLKHKVRDMEKTDKGKTDALGRWEKTWNDNRVIFMEAIDRKKKRERGDEETKSIGTQADTIESHVSKENGTADEQLLLEGDGKHVDDKYEELTRTKEDLEQRLEESEAASKRLGDRNEQLEERLAVSDSFWSNLSHNNVDVMGRENWLTEIQDSNTKLKDENERLTTFVDDLKLQLEAERHRPKPSRSTALPPAPSRSASPLPLSPAPQTPMLSSVLTLEEKPNHWKERELRLRNSETWRRNRDAILEQFKIQESERQIASEGTWEDMVNRLHGVAK